MINQYTIATKTTFLRKLIEQEIPEFSPRYQARCGMYLPILINDPSGCKMVIAKWGITGHGTNVTNIPMNRVLKNSSYNLMIRKNRCAIPANCFITVNQKGVWAVKMLRHRLFWMGGMYVERGAYYEFALLETEPGDVISHICESMPVMMPIDQFQKWLRARDVYSVMSQADRSGRQWFDYFKVDPAILSADQKKELLKPLGTTYAEYKKRDQEFKKINIEELRANSRGRK